MIFVEKKSLRNEWLNEKSFQSELHMIASTLTFDCKDFWTDFNFFHENTDHLHCMKTFIDRKCLNIKIYNERLNQQVLLRQTL